MDDMKRAQDTSPMTYFDALRIANPCYDSLPRATFHGATPDEWTTWTKEILRETLSAVLRKGLQLAVSGCAEELWDLEDQISPSLSDSVREASLAAGRHLLLSLTVPRGEKVLEKFVRRLQVDPTQGCHLAIAYAARCAAFHFAPRLCIASYVYQEAWSAFPKDSNFSEYVAIALREIRWRGQSRRLKAA
jgi:hypothetical protein